MDLKWCKIRRKSLEFSSVLALLTVYCYKFEFISFVTQHYIMYFYTHQADTHIDTKTDHIILESRITSTPLDLTYTVFHPLQVLLLEVSGDTW